MIREIEFEDLDTVNEWLQLHGSEPVHPSLLPKTGFVVDNIAAGFIYLTNSKAAWIDPVVSRPGARPKDVLRAIGEIVEGLVNVAKERGVRMVYGMTKRRSIARAVRRMGFAESPDGYLMLARRV